MSGGGGRGSTRRQARASVGGSGSLDGGSGGGGAAAVSELELAENGGSGYYGSRNNVHDPADTDGGRKGIAYPAPEAESGLTLSARRSLDERLEAMSEADSASEGEFR